MEIICLQDEAFYALIEHVIERIRNKEPRTAERWVSGEEAMKTLQIASKTTLQKLRDGGKIRFSQPEKKIILYDMTSILAYLNNHTKEPF